MRRVDDGVVRGVGADALRGRLVEEHDAGAAGQLGRGAGEHAAGQVAGVDGGEGLRQPVERRRRQVGVEDAQRRQRRRLHEAGVVGARLVGLERRAHQPLLVGRAAEVLVDEAEPVAHVGQRLARVEGVLALADHDAVALERLRRGDGHRPHLAEQRLERREVDDGEIVGRDADQLADHLGDRIGALVGVRRVDAVARAVGQLDPAVARDADRGGGAGARVEADQLDRVGAAVDVLAEHEHPDHAPADVDAPRPARPWSA